MPKVEEAKPVQLKPYLFHGVDLVWKDGDKDAIGECLFCGGSKFSVQIETSRARCWNCNVGNEKGGLNSKSFLEELYDKSFEETSDYSDLIESRKLMMPDALIHWGVCRSASTGEWLVPAFGMDGKLHQLYRYISAQGKMLLLPTPTFGHYLFGAGVYDKGKDIVYLCEGPWDGMAFWETLKHTKATDNGCMTTANIETSLASQCNVLAIPGCGSVGEPFKEWQRYFAGKVVVLLFDSDHPIDKNGKRRPSVGYEATKRAAKLLVDNDTPPAAISYLNWGTGGYDPSKPSGYDVRDALAAPGTALASRVRALEGLIGMIVPVPEAWVGKGAFLPRTSAPGLEPGVCRDYATLVHAWTKALKWTDGLDCALSSMLACIVSTKSIGDQLWLKVISPPSTCKSTLCEALSVAKKYVVAKDTIRGFHSGYDYQNDHEGADKKHKPLIEEIAGKTLIVKDADALLKAPNLAQILSEARGLYDTCSRSSYRNKMSKDYTGIRTTILLCGTSSLRTIDTSELGARFLDLVLMDQIDDELEDEILEHVARTADRNLNVQSDGRAETHQSVELTLAYQMTGGYVEFLRENANDILNKIQMSDVARRLCTRLGKFIALMRARPSRYHDEAAEREFAPRLVSQLVRFAKCTAAALNVWTVDDEVVRRTIKVALDTSRGHTLDMATKLYEHGEEGLSVPMLAFYLNNESEPKLRRLLKFLQGIGVTEKYVEKKNGLQMKPKWRLTRKMMDLYREVWG